MNSVSNTTGPYGGIGSNANTFGSASSSSTGGSKYAGYSKDSYKDQKYSGYSSKDNNNMASYKPGESYDSTEFKGLDKYRNKDTKDEPSSNKSASNTTTSTKKEEEEEKKKPFQTPVVPLPKPGDAPKTIGQIKILPPGQKAAQQPAVAT